MSCPPPVEGKQFRTARTMASNQTIEVGRDFGKELAERPRAAAQAALNPDRYADTPLPQAGVDQLQYDAQKNGFVPP